jgi:phage terminase large subunit GpA-like protein
MFKPPKNLRVSQWADENRVLTSEASAEPGNWRTSRAPYQREIMDVIADRSVEVVVFSKSSQVGATEIINNVIGYYIAQDPSPILVLQPTLDMARTWSKDRLAPMLKSSPALAGKVKEPRSRDSENTVLHKKFPGGNLSVVGANSASSLASRPVRILLCDEVDRYPDSAATEGDPIQLAIKRTQTFWNRKILMASTPTIDGVSRIQAAWETSDKRFYFVPCPHCEEMQKLEWKHVHWDDDNPDSVHYVCVHCGAVIEEKEKIKMLDQGEWRASEETNRVAGFHISELYSPWSTWQSMVETFLEVKKHPEQLKTFINTALGEVWRDQGDKIESNHLMTRRENYDASLIPDDVLVITAGCDIQKDRIEVQVIGWALDSQSYVVEYHILWGETAHKDVWDDLDTFLKSQYKKENGSTLKIACTTIDSGYQTQAVYNFCLGKINRRIFAIKGMSTAGKLIAGKATRVGKQRVPLIPVGTDTAKEVIFSWMQVDEVSPGYIHFPSDVDEEYFNQLTSEKRVITFVKGQKKLIFKPIRTRNEALDTFVYCLAAFHILRPNLERIAEVGVKETKRTPPVESHGFKRPPRKSFVNSWK